MSDELHKRVLDLFEAKVVRKEAEALDSHRGGCSSSRPLSENHNHLGLMGEFAFGKLCGIYPNVELTAKGDGGVDFTLPLKFTVDVKTARNAINLIHEKGKPFADIYVLAKYYDDKDDVRFLGWEMGAKLAKTEPRDFGKGILNHYIHHSKLRPMEQLLKRLK